MTTGMSTPEDLTTSEVWRDLQQYIRQTDADRDQLRQDRDELRREVRDGFTEVKTMIANLSFVPTGTYEADQRRQDEAHATLKVSVGALEDELKAKAATNRKLAIGAAVSIALGAGGWAFQVLVAAAG